MDGPRSVEELLAQMRAVVARAAALDDDDDDYLREGELERVRGEAARTRKVIERHADNSTAALGRLDEQLHSLGDWLGEYKDIARGYHGVEVDHTPLLELIDELGDGRNRLLALQAEMGATFDKLRTSERLPEAVHRFYAEMRELSDELATDLRRMASGFADESERLDKLGRAANERADLLHVRLAQAQIRLQATEDALRASMRRTAAAEADAAELRDEASRAHDGAVAGAAETAAERVGARALRAALVDADAQLHGCLLYTSPSPRD